MLNVRGRPSGWDQILRNVGLVRSHLRVGRVILEAGRLMAHAVRPDAAHLETAQQVAAHYDNARRFLDRVDGELDAAERLAHPGASPEPEPARHRADRRSGLDRRSGERRRHATAVAFERRRADRRVASPRSRHGT
jgi:hypothetical protein